MPTTSADDRAKFSNLSKNSEIQIFIIIFGFSMKKALKWVQNKPSIAVQWVLR